MARKIKEARRKEIVDYYINNTVTYQQVAMLFWVNIATVCCFVKEV